MKRLLLLAACAFCADASWNFRLPKCPTNDPNACIARDVGRDVDDNWFSNDYLVDGAMMSIAVKGDAIRWSCAGSDPTSSFAPRYEVTSTPKTVQLIDCNHPFKSSFASLLENLKLHHSSVKELTIKMEPQNIQWPTIDEQKQIDENMNKTWIAAEAYGIYPKNSLDKLNLQGIPMTLDQLISIYNIKTLILQDTGLTKVMNLSEFTKLHRLELYEPMLLDAELLNTSTALEELVLHAPDAGLASMPYLRNATFIEVYATGRIFGECKYLEILALYGRDLDHIPENWLAGCTQLWQLTLTHLDLHFLPDDLLSDTIRLQELDLSHNKLESLPEGLFSNTLNLQILNLKHNMLKELPTDLKPGPKNLKQLCVSHNNEELHSRLQRLPIDLKPHGLHYGECYNDKDNFMSVYL